MKAKGISWVGVGTDHYEQTLAMFTELLGFEIEIEADRQCILKTPAGQQVEIFGKSGRGKEANTPPTIAFEVDDVARARDELAAAGLEIVGEIQSWNGHEWLYFRSPDGYLFEVKKSPNSSD